MWDTCEDRRGDTCGILAGIHTFAGYAGCVHVSVHACVCVSVHVSECVCTCMCARVCE
jgi:molybdopterin-guanine dinucleotide biosynthesis protein A